MLVLDDFHELSNPAVLDGVATVLRRPPASLRMVLASRDDAPQVQARLPVADRPI